MRKLSIVVAALAATLASAAAPASAEPHTVVVCKSAIEPVSAAGCVIGGIVLHEAIVAKKPFGPNGEVARGAR